MSDTSGPVAGDSVTIAYHREDDPHGRILRVGDVAVGRAVELGCGCTRLEADRPGGGTVHVLTGGCRLHEDERVTVPAVGQLVKVKPGTRKLPADVEYVVLEVVDYRPQGFDYVVTIIGTCLEWESGHPPGRIYVNAGRLIVPSPAPFAPGVESAGGAARWGRP